MKLTINSAELNNAINLLSNVNVKVSQPILENYLICHKNGVVRLMASAGADMDACYLLQATSFEGEGKFCVNAKQLTSALKGLSAQDIVLTIDMDTIAITITHTYGVINLKGNSCESFPERIAVPKENAVSCMVAFNSFANDITTCLKATATDETRPAMCGVNVEFHEDYYTMTGTDGRRLYAIKRDAQCPDNVSFILPKAPAKLLGKCRGQGVANVSLSDNKCDIRIDSRISIRFRCVEGNYPNWRAVIPRKTSKTITTNADALKGSVLRVGNFGAEGDKVILRVKDGSTMIVTAKNEEHLFSSEESLSLSYTNVSQFAVGVCAPYLAEVLGLITSEDVTLHCTENNNPCVIKESEAGRTLLTLLMPMKLEGDEVVESVEDKPETTITDEFDLPTPPEAEEAPETGAVIINGVKIAEYEHHSIEV